MRKAAERKWNQKR